MLQLGDYAEDATIDFKFNTSKANGTPIGLGGTVTVEVYYDNNTTELSTGLTLTQDFDGVVGCHHIRLDLSASATYAVGKDYQIVLTSGTVDGTSQAGRVLAVFSIEKATADIRQIDGSNVAAANLRLSSLAVATGQVVDDVSNTDTTFKVDTTLGAKGTDYFGNTDGGMVLVFVSGTTNEWQSRRVVGFNTSTDFVTVEEAFSAEPTDTDDFILIGRITELS